MSSQASTFLSDAAPTGAPKAVRKLRRGKRDRAAVELRPATAGADRLDKPVARRSAFDAVLWLLVLAIPTVIAVEVYVVASWLAQ
jgi:hypothetical protein